MAKKRLPRAKSDEFVRTGGAMGDPSMAELDKFNQGGAGVSEKVEHTFDANDGVSLIPRLPGSEA